MRYLRFSLGVVLVALLGGCGPSDPLDRTVTAESSSAFAMWRSNVNGYLSADQQKDVDEATREIKLAIMNNREASGTDEVEAAMLAKINGHSLRDMLRLAYESKIKRLEVDLKGLNVATEQNGRLVTRTGDTASSNYLTGFRERQKARQDSVEGELKSAQEKLKALSAPAGSTSK